MVTDVESGGKQGKKKKKRNGGWIEVSGRKPTAARAMEEKVQEGEKAVEGARKAKIELRQEDWGVPVVDHTELAEATVAFAPMASARRIRREGMPEGSAVVTVAALEGSRRTDVVCRVDGAEKGYVTRSPEGDDDEAEDTPGDARRPNPDQEEGAEDARRHTDEAEDGTGRGSV
ncbi:hypothetical protein DIPPA_00777 [Diplonema papillatum]|nr:hypothetical protein DIPPA_00777 [Diplonema papillatum]